MKKLITVCLIIAIIFTIMPNVINASATTTDEQDTTIIEPVNFVDENGNEYTLTFSKNVKTKKIFGFSLGEYISSFDITMEKSTSEGEKITYKYRTKERFWLWAPKTVEKALKKDKLSEIYDLWEEFQISYIRWDSVKDMTDDEFREKILNDISDSAYFKQNEESENFSIEIEDNLDLKDDIKGVFENKVIDKYCPFNPDDYVSMVEDTVELTKKIEKTFSFFTGILNMVSDALNGIEQVKSDTDSKIHSLFEKLAANEKFESHTTYQTKFASVNHITAPSFEFVFPNDWEITKEEINKSEGIYEVVELTNTRGVAIRYVQHSGTFSGARDMMTCEITKVADAALELEWVQGTDYSNTGNIVVAKIHDITYGDITGKYKDKYDKYFYAIIPESFLDTTVYNSADEWRINRFSIKYGDHLSFIAQSPDGKFTAQEEQEIIQILSSFKEVVH